MKTRKKERKGIMKRRKRKTMMLMTKMMKMTMMTKMKMKMKKKKHTQHKHILSKCFSIFSIDISKTQAVIRALCMLAKSVNEHKKECKHNV